MPQKWQVVDRAARAAYSFLGLSQALYPGDQSLGLLPFGTERFAFKAAFPDTGAPTPDSFFATVAH
jgi:hypothetical protein